MRGLATVDTFSVGLGVRLSTALELVMLGRGVMALWLAVENGLDASGTVRVADDEEFSLEFGALCLVAPCLRRCLR